ncbi:unnamed protein product [Euphydryas editha]|uniref:MADF domain-containing protein n=1 Tax=Euphydryas editha TaxID=104508 RepID=A0AAU9TS82_EUPED|nr:unnamed protein product [Euphydryas editha]
MQEIITERDVLIELFQLYKDYQCLWDTSHELYCNRDARKQAFAVLKQCYSKFEKDATVEDVKKKLENMKKAYKRERKKVSNNKNLLPILLFFAFSSWSLK